MTETIDFSKVYRIEAIPSRDSKELADKGLSTFPGITQGLSASWNDLLKKYEGTGFDEHAPEVLRLPVEKRVEVQKRIKEKREELESLIGKPDYLKPTSDAWMSELCMMHIEVGQDLKIRVNGGTNELRPAESYKDAIALALIMNSKTFPKCKADIHKPEYKNAKFYLTTSEETATFTKEALQKKKRGYVELSKLFDEGKNKQRAWEIAFKLGLVNKQKVESDVLEEKLHNAIFLDKTGKTLESFLDACKLDNSTLLVHNMFQQAINMGVVRVSSDGVYHRGVVNYRKTKQESIEYLLSAGNEVELGELRGEVDSRKKKHSAIG